MLRTMMVVYLNALSCMGSVQVAIPDTTAGLKYLQVKQGNQE